MPYFGNITEKYENEHNLTYKQTLSQLLIQWNKRRRDILHENKFIVTFQNMNRILRLSKA